MKLVKVEVTNYRSLVRDNAEGIFVLELADGMNALIGPNNCGKSNVLRAVALALDPTFPFNRERDTPAGMAWTSGRVTLEFRCDQRVSMEGTLLRYAHDYEMSANGGSAETYANQGIVRLTVFFRSGREGWTRQEHFYARGAGAVIGERQLQDQSMKQFRRCLRFVLIESGQSLESLLAGKFREILHTVIQEDLKSKFDAANRRRTGYVEGLQDELLDPLRQRIKDVVCDLFPEVKDVSLVPQVSSIEDTLSNVAINVTDAIETSLAAKGTGVRGAVMVAMLRYLADHSKRSMVFAVEEPEAFLHPAAQEELRDDLEGLGQRRDVTVLVTTHSPFVVSRDPKAKVIALTKDPEGRTRLSGQAYGADPHASLLGGLFRDAALPDILDRSARLPANAQGVLVVEGTTDEDFLRITVTKLKRPDLLADVYITPADGAEKAVVQAVLIKQQTPKPILVLLDDDDIGRACRDNLEKRFGFDKRREVMFYRDVAGDRPGGTEAEDLFPSALMERFVRDKGEVKVVKSKVARREGGWRYDLNQTGKESIPEWIEDRVKPADLELWLELILAVRKRLGLPDSTIVPRVSDTSVEQTVKTQAASRQWDEASFFQELSRRVPPDQLEAARRVYDWGKQHQDKEWWGQGTNDGCYYPGFNADSVDYWPIALWTYGRIQINFQTLANRPAFADENVRRELRDRLNGIPGAPIPETSLAKRPSLPLSLLTTTASMSKLLEALDWVVSRTRGKRHDGRDQTLS